jgi:hypothetical protein
MSLIILIVKQKHSIKVETLIKWNIISHIAEDHVMIWKMLMVHYKIEVYNVVCLSPTELPKGC